MLLLSTETIAWIKFLFRWVCSVFCCNINNLLIIGKEEKYCGVRHRGIKATRIWENTKRSITTRVELASYSGESPQRPLIILPLSRRLPVVSFLTFSCILIKSREKPTILQSVLLADCNMIYSQALDGFGKRQIFSHFIQNEIDVNLYLTDSILRHESNSNAEDILSNVLYVNGGWTSHTPLNIQHHHFSAFWLQALRLWCEFLIICSRAQSSKQHGKKIKQLQT